MPGLRVVLDTNVLVSGLGLPGQRAGAHCHGLASGRVGGRAVALHPGRIVKVLPRLPRVSMTPTEIRDLVDSFMFLADVVEPAGARYENLRDPADLPVLLTLVAAKADYLVTGDKDLLALASQYPIVTPAVFWTRHGV